MKSLNSSMLRYNLRLLPLANLLICILALMAIQLVFSLKMIDFKGMADIGELFLSLTGIVLLPGLVFTDANSQAREMVYSKAVSPVVPLVVRFFYCIAFLLLEITAFTAIAAAQGSRFDAFSIIAGVFISAFVLGTLGYAAGSFTDNIALSYLLPFAYYGFEFATKGKYTQELYLFSLRRGSLEEGKWILLAAAVVLIVVSMLRQRHYR